MMTQDGKGERREAREKPQSLPELEKRFVRATLDSISSQAALIDASGEIVIVNKAWNESAKANGADPRSVSESVNYLTVCDSAANSGLKEAAVFAEGIRSVLSGRREEFGMEYPCNSPSERRWFIGRVTPFSGAGPPRAVVVHDNVTKPRALQEELAHRASRDPLTDLPNRTMFVERLGQALSRAGRQGGEVVVLFLDLDNFKYVNDSLGHEVGDGLLIEVAARLETQLRPEDTVARFGGDEFAILIEDATGLTDAIRAAERLLQGLQKPFAVGDREVSVSASVGIAFPTSPQDRPEDLLREADAAMYEAKKRGSGHYQVFDPTMQERARERLTLESGLRRAVERGEFVVHYQPKVRLEDGMISGLEALVRWEHPERGIVYPSEFVPLAEETGLIVPIGSWMLQEACEQARRWQVDYPKSPPLLIEVNASVRQLEHPDFLTTVERALKQSGLEARCLCVDVTEATLLMSTGVGAEALKHLKEKGVQVSIDDFGTGYSSLSYLRQFSLDSLKIDQSFIRGLGKEVEETILVEMIVNLAHALGLHCIAEGIENADQATELRRMGCDTGQGYYFSEPLTPEAVPKFLA